MMVPVRYLLDRQQIILGSAAEELERVRMMVGRYERENLAEIAANLGSLQRRIRDVAETVPLYLELEVER